MGEVVVIIADHNLAAAGLDALVQASRQADVDGVERDLHSLVRPQARQERRALDCGIVDDDDDLDIVGLLAQIAGDDIFEMPAAHRRDQDAG